MARPSKLTPTLRKAIAKRVKDGNFPEVAAQCEGISESTFYRWMQRGESEGSGPFWELCQDVTRARAEAESAVLKEIRESADRDGNKNHSTWFAERWARDRWGKQIDVRVRDQAVEQVIERLREGLDPGTFRQCLAVLSGENSEPGTDPAPAIH